jgi:large subunit ribosomal protein L6
MSRLGQKPVPIPEKVAVSIENGVVTVVGPKGTLSRKMRDEIEISVQENEVILQKKKETKLAAALWGTYTSHVSNMIQGVHEGYVKKLIIEGVGYRAEMKGATLEMQLGYSHPVTLQVPEGLEILVEKNQITVTGIDKELVGFFSALIRSKRKPEPYKGKGIRYNDEVVRRKQGKKTA